MPQSSRAKASFGRCLAYWTIDWWLLIKIVQTIKQLDDLLYFDRWNTQTRQSDQRFGKFVNLIPSGDTAWVGGDWWLISFFAIMFTLFCFIWNRQIQVAFFKVFLFWIIPIIQIYPILDMFLDIFLSDNRAFVLVKQIIYPNQLLIGFIRRNLIIVSFFVDVKMHVVELGD